MNHAIIPTGCLKFVAACATAGIELEKGSKGISNTYSKDQKYDPDEPGKVFYYLSESNGYGPINLAKVWDNPDQDLSEYADLDGRLRNCRDAKTWLEIADDLEALALNCAFANIRRFSRNEFSVDSPKVSDEETFAAELLDKLPGQMRAGTFANRVKIANSLKSCWEPAMFAWIKAFIANYLELKNAWKAARPSIRIERENNPYPLIIPKGKQTRELLRRWA